MCRVKLENRPHRYDLNRFRLRYGYKYTKYKVCLGLIIVMCNKQHISNMWR